VSEAPVRRRRWLLAPALAAVAYLGLVLWGDAGRILGALRSFPPTVGLLCVAAVSLGFVLRWLKFELYLRRLDVRIPARESLTIFLAGMSMAVTPGKLGEVLKSFLLRDRAGVPVSRTAAVVLLERVTDVVALLVILALGRSADGVGWVEGIAGGGALALLLVLLAPGPAIRALGRETPGWRGALARALEAGRVVAAPGTTLAASLLSVPAWGLEALVLSWMLGGLGAELPLAAAAEAYAFSTLAGAVSMLPGGLGAAEGSLAWMLEARGATASVAVAATLLLRLATLWFAVGVGILALVALGRAPADAVRMATGQGGEEVE
jgi:uncharacterized membrane protein YbhN (UPF0104 family)